MKFVMTQAVCPQGLEILKGKAEVYIADNADPNNYLEQMQTADALVVRIASCNANIIENSPNLKVIGRTGVGYDSVDVEAATKAGIPVVITPGANNRSVAEHAVGMMFAVAKNFVEAQTQMAVGNWKIRDAGKAFELLGKKVGFIGFGAIGRETQKICAGMGMETAAYDPFLAQAHIEGLGCGFYEDYREMLKACDVISVHVPLTAETKDMIGMDELSSMKSSAIIINCSRGGIINEDALIWALNEGVIAGAGTDVFTEEPPCKGSELLKTKNLIYSPHSAAQTKEAVIRMAQMCIEGCLAVVNGEQWPHVADLEVYNHPRWEKKRRT